LPAMCAELHHKTNQGPGRCAFKAPSSLNQL